MNACFGLQIPFIPSKTSLYGSPGPLRGAMGEPRIVHVPMLITDSQCGAFGFGQAFFILLIHGKSVIPCRVNVELPGAFTSVMLTNQRFPTSVTVNGPSPMLVHSTVKRMKR